MNNSVLITEPVQMDILEIIGYVANISLLRAYDVF